MTQRKANFLLATVAIGWGSSYLFMKLLVGELSPFNILVLRYMIAFVAVAVIFRKRMLPTTKATLVYSAVLGALQFAIISFVLVGLQYTSASSAGFLTCTAVVIVPMLQAVITRTFPSRRIVIGVIAVSAGLVFMMLGDRMSFDAGSLYCLASAFLYAVLIIAVKRFTQNANPLQLGIYQNGFAFVFASIAMLLFEQPRLPSTPLMWASSIGLALICSAYCFVVQPVAQKHTTAEAAGFLFALEPVASAVLAFVFLHERIGLRGYIGSVLILAGVIYANTPHGPAKTAVEDSAAETAEKENAPLLATTGEPL